MSLRAVRGSIVTEGIISLGAGSVFARSVGDGPPVLLINGLSLHTATWGVLERNLEGHRIIEFDLPGAGQSDVPKWPVSIRSLARLTTSVLDHFQIERADVVGFSMGGIIAQQLAADAPERVRRLVLMATTPGVGGMQGDPKAMLSLAAPLRFFSPQAYAKSLGSLTGGRGRRDKVWIAEQTRLRMEYKPEWKGYFGQMASIAPWSGLPRLARVNHPTLVLAGDDDPLTPVVNGMMLAHLLPNGRLTVLSGEGHLMVMDADSMAHPAIREFLSAQSLDKAPVWQQAVTVSGAQLQAALATSGRQLPPWSIANARMRRRWLRPAGESA